MGFSLTQAQLRIELAKPLKHREFVNIHRNYFEGNFVTDLKYPIEVYDHLKAFPDIIRVILFLTESIFD